MAPTPPPSEPIAFTVVLARDATEVEAANIRTAIRQFSQVAAVKPVGESSVLTTAEDRARLAYRAEVEPIFAEAMAAIQARCDEATARFEAVTDEVPAPRLADSPTPQRVAGNGHGNGAVRPVNGARNGQVPPQRDPRHAAPRGVTPGR